MIAAIFLIIVLYIFLHEKGHALAVVAFGGTINEIIVLGFNARIRYSGVYGIVANGTIIVFGTLFPLIIFVIAFIFYKPDINFKSQLIKDCYHYFYLIFASIFIAPLFTWVFLVLPESQDPIFFIIITGIQPLVVAFSSFALLLLVGFFIYKKKLIHNVLNLFRETRFLSFPLENFKGKIILQSNADVVLFLPQKRKKQNNFIVKSTAIIASFALIIVGIFATLPSNNTWQQPGNPHPAYSIRSRRIMDVRETGGQRSIIHNFFITSGYSFYTLTVDVLGGNFVMFLTIEGVKISYKNIGQSFLNEFTFLSSARATDLSIQIWIMADLFVFDNNRTWLERYFSYNHLLQLRNVYSGNNFSLEYNIKLRRKL